MKRSSGDGGRLGGQPMVYAVGEVVPAPGTASTSCPSCGGPLLDLRGSGFNAAAVARGGDCVLVTDTDYTCAVEQRKRDARR
jgi:hypothetical protein